MPLNTAFRLSFYATMALACCCLAVGELFFLGWMGYVLPCALVLIVVAYFAEGRRQLSLRASNVVGLVVAVAIGAWAYYYMPREEKDFIELGLPWPAALLPYLGPLLMVLLVLKLFQAKRAGDFWALQAIGLMAVALACILSSDSLFGLLLAAYMAAVIWCLALHHCVRQRATALGASAPSRAPLFERTTAAATFPWRRGGLAQVVRWSACVVLVGFCVFLAAPRQSNDPWQPDKLSNGTYSVGIGIENTINLASTGAVELTDDVAFELTAESIDGPVTNLSPSTLYFVNILDYYDHGQWLDWYSALRKRKWENYTFEPIRTSFQSLASNPSLPRTLAADGVYLTFYVPQGLAFTKPLAYPPRRDIDLGIRPQLDAVAAEPYFQRASGWDIVSTNKVVSPTFARVIGGGVSVTKGPFRSARGTENSFFSYGQVVNPAVPSELVPAARDLLASYREQLLKQDVPPPISQWVRSLIPRLPGLTSEPGLLDENGLVPVADQHRAAVYLCAHLSSSGEYGYSLNLRRREQGDPTVDFLLNVKEGHCTRFAGGLALMLRAVGIPSRIVMGFRGQEGGENGEYRVRMKSAHSWVQALVKTPGTDAWQWLTLDPTPGAAAKESRLLGPLGLFGSDGIDLTQLWRSFVLDFTADRQARSQRALLARLKSWSTWLVVGGLVGAAFALRRFRPKWRAFAGFKSRNGSTNGEFARPDIAWYENLLTLLAQRLALRPTAGQTPREFSEVARARLELRSIPAGLAGAPRQIVDLLYSVRFGAQEITIEKCAGANRVIEELRDTLLDSSMSQRSSS
ncbi:MAG: transglutaminase domain-containing protein [Planctomycetes bacterium]|nr:transglutaminase domain-containing protein [Planctomycetota bacterium]